MTQSSVLFCPFCREAFEDLTRCPTHELVLVPFRELQRIIDASQDDVALSFWSPRLGRGLVMLGALLTCVAFFLPLASLSGQVESSSTLFALARVQGIGMRLWFVPMSAFALVLMLYRRRTPVSMRGARLAALLLALLPSVFATATLWGIYGASERMTQVMGGTVHTHIGAGMLLVWTAALPLLLGALRLGVAPTRRVQS